MRGKSRISYAVTLSACARGEAFPPACRLRLGLSLGKYTLRDGEVMKEAIDLWLENTEGMKYCTLPW